MTETVIQVPAIGVSVNEQIGTRSIVLQTHIGGDAKAEEIDALLDRLLKAADRQKLYYETREELFKLRLNLDNHILQLGSMMEDLERVDKELKLRWDESGRKGEFKPTTAERQNRNNILKSADAFKVNIARLKEAIAENEAILKKTGKE